ncbi:MAG: excinuclease ABC subunit C, partial [Chloroflexota bacterium]
EPALMKQWLAERRQGPVKLSVPKRGQKKELIDLLAENAREYLEQMRLRWLNDDQKTMAALAELQEALNMPKLPGRIECYDISNIQGTSAVGSMV